MAEPPFGVGHKPAAFSQNRVVRIADIRDGTSNTMAIGEYLTGIDSPDDDRGMLWDDRAGLHSDIRRVSAQHGQFRRALPLWCTATTDTPRT